MHSHFKPLIKVPWEWRVELTFTDMALFQLRGKGKFSDPSRLVFANFIRNVAVGEGLVVGAAHVFIEAGHEARPHAHVLLVGRSKTGKTLAGVTQARLAGYWHFGRAHAQRVDNNVAAVGYLANNCRQGKDSFNLSGNDLLNEWLHEQPKASAAPPW